MTVSRPAAPQDGAAPAPAARRNSFDLVRLGAALAVLFGHQADLAGRPEPALGPLGISLSNTGLFVFFALSGYLIFKSLERDPRPRRFTLARVRRIYPGLAVNVLACVALGAAVTALPLAAYLGSGVTWSFLWHGVTLLPPTRFELPGVFAAARWPAVNTPVWTLKYEILCYAALLALYKGARLDRAGARRRMGVTGAAAAALTVGYVAYLALAPLPPEADFYSRINGYNLLRFGTLFAGGAFAAASEGGGAPARGALVLVPAALAALGPAPAVTRAGLTLLVGLLAVELGRSPLLYSRRYRRLGDLSYGTYLYAYPIQQLLIGHTGLPFWPTTVLTLATTLAAATLSWHLVERRCSANACRNRGLPPVKKTESAPPNVPCRSGVGERSREPSTT